MFETQTSRNKTSSGEIGLDIRTHASPNMGQDQVSGWVSVLYWELIEIVIKLVYYTIHYDFSLVWYFRTIIFHFSTTLFG